MRVVFFVGTLQAGGLERFVTRVSLKAKQEKQFVPLVVCLNKRTGIFLDELLTAKVDVYEAPARWFRSPLRWWRLVRLLKNIKPNIVHSQVNFSMLQQFLASWMAGVPFTVTERNCYQRSGWALWRRRFQYGFLKFFGVQYSANSQRVANHLATMLREKPETFTVLPNGMEVLADHVLRPNQGKPELPIRIAYVARMAPHKGHIFFLDVLQQLIFRQKVDCKAALIGDGSMRHAVEQTIIDKKLVGHVTLTGVVNNVEDYLINSDIVCLLSEFEGMPNVIMEAMAVGKPVIATDIGNAGELLSGGAGIVLQTRDIENAVQAFEQLSRQPELRMKMGEYGKSRIIKDFSLTSTMNRLIQYYRSIVDTR